MSLPVRWTETAEQDLTEIVEYIRQDQPEAALKIGSRLFELSFSLGTQPMRGAVVPELRGEGVRQYRQVLLSPYRVIYSVRGGSAVIESILDSRRNLSAILTERFLR